ncbi:MAG: YbdK family carboxylate-amine ligase [Candidatus Marinimicrobia bacterium]|nr:YbdK family carboxylate-amine ligase [Candidatus Neomarinimicrobiota bacterium]
MGKYIKKEILEIYGKNEPLTIGVEEEYQLCDPDSGDLVSRVDDLMEAADSKLRGQFSYELLLSVLELRTGINRTVDETVEAIAEMRRKTAELASRFGIVLGLSGAHPYAKWQEQKFVATEDYQWVMNQLQYLAKRNITFGLHIHIGLDDPNKAVRVSNGLRRWIAPLMAISANSPFFDGVRTGMMSSRTVQFGTFPRTGLPPHLEGFEEYETLVNKLIEAGSITKARQIWWKVRPHLTFGTVELRMFDVHASLKRTGAFIALSQALVCQLVEEFEKGKLERPVNDLYLLDGYWKARRFGLDCDIICPYDGAIRSMRDEVRKMIDTAMPYAKKLGTSHWLEEINIIIEEGSGAEDMLKLWSEVGEDLVEMQKRLIDSVEYEVEEKSLVAEE